MTKELLTPALITASLTNDLYSFEKEKGDANVQNAVLVVMKEHGCSEKKAREICKERIRVEVAKYIRVVKDTRTRTDISDEVKRYVEVMQYTLSGNVAWSTQCPRYNDGAKFNKLQMLRAEYGLEKYPATWPPKDADGLSVTTESKLPCVNGVNGNGVNGNGVRHSNGVDNHSINANGHKRKRSVDDVRANGTNGVKKLANGSRLSADSLILEDVVSLALDWNLPDLSDHVSWTHFPRLIIPSELGDVHGAVVDSCSLGRAPTVSIPSLPPVQGFPRSGHRRPQHMAQGAYEVGKDDQERRQDAAWCISHVSPSFLRCHTSFTLFCRVLCQSPNKILAGRSRR